jgi:hypothetical protein
MTTTIKHVPALMLDAFVLGALDRDTEAHIQAHLESCSTCSGDLEAAAELRKHFTQHVFPRGLPARRRYRWWWLAAPALAAAVLILALRPPRELPADVAIKGDASWQVFANRNGRIFPVQDGTELAAGDRLRFAIILDGARYLLVASIDGSGAATIYYPYDGAQSAAAHGERIEPTGSIELDDASGPERIYAILSDAPIDAAEVKAQLRVVARGGADAIRRTRSLPVPARAQISLVFEKVAP